jgi:hypothetical protein
MRPFGGFEAIAQSASPTISEQEAHAIVVDAYLFRRPCARLSRPSTP